MSETINWTFNVQVEGGPIIAASDTIIVDAYDKVKVEVKDGSTDSVEVQPGDTDSVQFLLINSDKFDEHLTYKINGAGNDIKLDALQVLIGNGAVALLSNPPQSLEITNKTGKDPVTIEVIVGRKAV